MHKIFGSRRASEYDEVKGGEVHPIGEVGAEARGKVGRSREEVRRAGTLDASARSAREKAGRSAMAASAASANRTE